MSITNQNITFPDTLRTLAVNSDKFKLTESLFVTLPDFSFTEEEFEDEDFWFDHLGIDIFPIHKITEFNPEDEANTLTQSQQDFTYKSRKGKYKHRFQFDWSLDYHQLINELNSSQLRVIYASQKYLRATKVDNDDIRGFLLNTFELEPIKFMQANSTGNSEIFLEWFDSDELNVNGYEVEMDWPPKALDRLFLRISLSFGDGTISMGLSYLNEPVTGISPTDVTITDDINGNITFSLDELGNGAYQLSNFSNNISNAKIYVESTLYVGCKRFRFVYVVSINDNFDFYDGTDFEFYSGDTFEFYERI